MKNTTGSTWLRSFSTDPAKEDIIQGNFFERFLVIKKIFVILYSFLNSDIEDKLPLSLSQQKTIPEKPFMTKQSTVQQGS
jgi:hypothetical protein